MYGIKGPSFLSMQIFILNMGKIAHTLFYC